MGWVRLVLVTHLQQGKVGDVKEQVQEQDLGQDKKQDLE